MSIKFQGNSIVDENGNELLRLEPGVFSFFPGSESANLRLLGVSGNATVIEPSAPITITTKLILPANVNKTIVVE